MTHVGARQNFKIELHCCWELAFSYGAKIKAMQELNCEMGAATGATLHTEKIITAVKNSSGQQRPTKDQLNFFSISTY